MTFVEALKLIAEGCVCRREVWSNNVGGICVIRRSGAAPAIVWAVDGGPWEPESIDLLASDWERVAPEPEQQEIPQVVAESLSAAAGRIYEASVDLRSRAIVLARDIADLRAALDRAARKARAL